MIAATNWVEIGGVAQLAAAGATLALAAITAWMAKRTHEVATKTEEAADAAVRTARATEADVQQGLRLVEIGQDQVLASQAQTAAVSEQAEVARRSLEANFQPLLVPVVDRLRKDQFLLRGFDGVSVVTELGAEPRCWIGKDASGTERFFAIVPVRNIGAGPASFRQKLTDSTFVPQFSGSTPLYGRPSSPVVAAGDLVDVVFYGVVDNVNLSIVNSAPGTIHLATVAISYSDISRAKNTVTRLELGKADGPLLHVTEVLVEP